MFEDEKYKENLFYYEMQQARKKDTERLKNDKTFREFVKEGEDAMQIPEKERMVACPTAKGTTTPQTGAASVVAAIAANSYVGRVNIDGKKYHES